MGLFVGMVLIGAVAYFAWRHSSSQPRRIVANIGGVVAIIFLLLAIYGLIRYWMTAAP